MATLDGSSVGCTQPFAGGPQLTDVCSADTGALFLLLLTNLINSNEKINDPCGRVTPVKTVLPRYDFIVVGGGAAGPIVASRLSEVPDWNVLLIEAGPDEPAGTQVPANLQLYLNTELDWKFVTTNESHACLNNNGSCSWPRGKNLGGCTSHHGMAYHRGHRKDYERWVEMGNVGWSWEEVFPYFLMSEDNQEIGRVSGKYHAVGGPMTVERFPWQPNFAWDILQAAEEAGLGTTEDMVGEKITGFTVAQTLSKNGVRQSTASAYLRPVRNRKNLHVVLEAQATKVLTRKNTAYGVQFVKDKRTHTVRAKREVILSAGSVNSPQLLLLSGIGPQEHLKSVGIPVVQDLPGVGENLHNHASFGVDFTMNTSWFSELSVQSADEYINNQTGPLSATGLAQVTGILASSFATSDDPDIQIFFAGFQGNCESKAKIADLTTYDGKETVRFSSVNLRPLSRGRLTLRDKNPLSPPMIWSNDLAEPQDVSVIIEGLRAIFRLANSTVMQRHQLTLASPRLKECSDFKEGSDEYWRCAIHWNTRPENHQSGSCKMGPSADPMAVVDPELKVHGVKALRVADASVMPKVVSGNPVAAINMIGERAAAFIKKDWGAPANL